MNRDEAIWLSDAKEEAATLKRQLREITGEDSEKWHLLGLTKSEERVLRVLLIRDFVPMEAFETALYWDKPEIADSRTLQVFICRIKEKLPFLREWIKPKYGQGYWLHPEGKHRLMFELQNPGVAQ